MWWLGHPSSIVRVQEGAAPGLLGGPRAATCSHLGLSSSPVGPRAFVRSMGAGPTSRTTASLLRDSPSRREKALGSSPASGWPCLTNRA